MNKKLLISLLSVVVVAGVAFGATRAFFSDTEVSAGNVFTAGAIDLKVDHTRQIYNGVDCKACNIVVKSDITNDVYPVNNPDPTHVFPKKAEVVKPTTITDQYWIDPVGDSDWIWVTSEVTAHDYQQTVTYAFEKTFYWNGPKTGASLTFGIAADNRYKVLLNGNEVDSGQTNEGYSSSVIDVPQGDITPFINENGLNTLRFEVTNLAQPQLPAVNNPGGLMYELVINGDCDSDFFQQYCKLWQSKDLVEGDIFYNFDDIKPGDSGLNVISLRVTSNDSYACLNPSITTTSDQDINEPEQSDEPVDSSNKGEIEDWTYFFAWHDDGNGIYDGSEQAITSVPVLASSFLTNPQGLYEPSTVLPADETRYLAIAWCMGEMSVPAYGQAFTCNGGSVNNAAQTDLLETTLSFYVEQSRNNDNFSCIRPIVSPSPSNNPTNGSIVGE